MVAPLCPGVAEESAQTTYDAGQRSTELVPFSMRWHVRRSVDVYDHLDVSRPLLFRVNDVRSGGARFIFRQAIHLRLGASEGGLGNLTVPFGDAYSHLAVLSMWCCEASIYSRPEAATTRLNSASIRSADVSQEKPSANDRAS